MTYESIPTPYELVLLALASYRVWRLLAEDDILDSPRMWLLRLPRKWKDGDSIPVEYREKWATFLTCPFCLGFYVSLGFYLFWIWEPQWTLVAATVGAISAAVGLIRGNLDVH